MAKYTKLASCVVQAAYTSPKLPHDISLSLLIPYDALITRIRIEYVNVPRAEAEAAWQQSIEDTRERVKKTKRHNAAVKANATRKAKKAESEAANG